MNGARVGDLPERESLTEVDRWILDRLDQVVARQTPDSRRTSSPKACEALYHFAWDEFCDWYRTDQGAVRRERRGTFAPTSLVLGHVLDKLLRTLSPVMPFVTEVLWKSLTGGDSW